MRNVKGAMQLLPRSEALYQSRCSNALMQKEKLRDMHISGDDNDE